MSTPNGRTGGRAGERPLVSVTGPAGFLFLPPRTDRKTQTRQSGAEVRAKNRTCKRRPRYSPGGRGPAPRSPSALCRSSPQLHPNHSAIASNYAFISELCLGTAPIFRRVGRTTRTASSCPPFSSRPASPSRAVSFEIHKAAAFSLSMAQWFHNCC